MDLHEAELKKHGKDYEFHRYDGAGHGFMRDGSDDFREAAATDAWKRTLDLFAAELR